MKLLLAFCITGLLTITAIGQADNSTKLIIENKSVVEIVPEERDESSNFVKLNVKVNGRTVKSFAATDFTFPQVIGSFHGIVWNLGQNSDAEYVLYRTSMGNGACAGGTLYVLAFLEDEQTNEFKDVHVSPALTTCLGEYPVFAFSYSKAGTILDIAGHTLNLDKLDKWIEKKKPAPVKKKIKIGGKR